MSSRFALALSLAMNVALLALGVAVWRQSTHPRLARLAPTLSRPKTASPEIPSVTVTADASPDSTAPAPTGGFHWRSIESADYRLYMANLRAVGCPERLIRDILVADIEALYRARLTYQVPYREPWIGLDIRAADAREATTARHAARQEKRALIRELLGYDWDAQVGEAWVSHREIALLTGFLPETKLMQLVAIHSAHEDSWGTVERAADGILLAEDKAQIRAVREQMVATLRQALTPAEIEEIQLRAQLSEGFPDGLHLDGVELSAPELRDLARASLAFRDVLFEELLQVGFEVPEEERDRRREVFERAVAECLGETRFEDYQRAQESEFRQLYQFAQESGLTRNHAVRAYDYWRNAMAEAETLADDPTLSDAERSTAATVLRQTVTKQFQTLLGASTVPEFLEPWAEQLASTVQRAPPQSEKE